jgi:hypothetical protein
VCCILGTILALLETASSDGIHAPGTAGAMAQPVTNAPRFFDGLLSRLLQFVIA